MINNLCQLLAKVPQICLSSRPNAVLSSVSQLWSFHTGPKAPQPAGRRFRPQRWAEAKRYLSGAPPTLLAGPKGPVLRTRRRLAPGEGTASAAGGRAAKLGGEHNPLPTAASPELPGSSSARRRSSAGRAGEARSRLPRR